MFFSEANLQSGIRYCQENKPAQLQNLIQNGYLSPDSVVPNFQTKSLQRHQVPLISIAVYSDSLECVKILIKSGANIEKEDNVIFLILMFI